MAGRETPPQQPDLAGIAPIAHGCRQPVKAAADSGQLSEDSLLKGSAASLPASYAQQLQSVSVEDIGQPFYDLIAGRPVSADLDTGEVASAHGELFGQLALLELLGSS
jgi:hypothetical protein